MSALDHLFASATTNGSVESEDPSLGAPLTGPIPSQRRTELEVEVERLQKRRAIVQSRLLQTRHTQEQLEQEQEEADKSLEVARALLDGMQEPRHEQLRAARQHITQAEEAAKSLRLELADVVLWFEDKKGELEAKIQGHVRESVRWQRKVRRLVDLEDEEPPPGPRWLHFVDSDLWKGCSGLIVLVNMLVLGHELMDEDPMLNYDLSFLAFYTVELVLHLIYKQKTFLLGHFWVVCWNWVDLFIVTVGVAEVTLSATHNLATNWLVGMRIARVTRVARLLKLLHGIMRADPHWARGHIFQSFMMGVIIANLIVMAFENPTNKDLNIWFYLENSFLVVYTFELTMTIRLEGCRFFYSSEHILWNWLDFVIVTIGIIDQWVVPTLKLEQSGEEAESSAAVITMLRMLRLLRVLQLVRMVKHIPPLYVLITGIAKAMQGMGWVMVLTMSVLYVCALIGVKLVGSGLVLPAGDPSTDDVKETFSNIPDAVFELFKAMNADLGGLDPLFNSIPSAKYVMMVFMVLTNWALFSILTAVVSDNMANVTQTHQAEVDAEERDAKRTRCEEEVGRIFKRIDQDGELETMTEGEFMALMTDEIACYRLCQVTGLTKSDLKDVFVVSAGGDDGEGIRISKEDFVRALDRENRPVTLRSVKKLEQRLLDIEESLAGRSSSSLRVRKFRSNVL